jgi:alpha-tubulin suppressor-like RCC1 family protein
MPAEALRAAREVPRRRAISALLIPLAAGLCVLPPSPQPASAASPGASSISAGGFHSCAIESGRAYCWGFNQTGQLGDGTTADSIVPVAVDTSGVLAGKTLTQITAGEWQTCAVDAVGAAYCWGYNAEGQLGDGTTADSIVPVAVDATGVLAGQAITQITAGWQSTCALGAGGTAYCWGANNYGELGDGSIAGSSVPVAVDATGVLAGKTITQITAGDAQHLRGGRGRCRLLLG